MGQAIFRKALTLYLLKDLNYFIKNLSEQQMVGLFYSKCATKASYFGYLPTEHVDGLRWETPPPKSSQGEQTGVIPISVKL